MWRVRRARDRGRSAATLATLFALALPSTRAAAEPKPEIGFRSGYAVPFGKIYERDGQPDDLHDFAKGQVPIWFDIGARIHENLFVGAYFQSHDAKYLQRAAYWCEAQTYRGAPWATFHRPDFQAFCSEYLQH